MSNRIYTQHKLRGKNTLVTWIQKRCLVNMNVCMNV